MLGFAALGENPLGALSSPANFIKVTEQADTAAISALARTSINATAAEQADTAAISALVRTSITASVTEQVDAAAISALARTEITASVTEQADTAISALVRTEITASVTEQADTAAVTSILRSGVFLATNDNADLALITASATTLALLSSVEQTDKLTGNLDCFGFDYLDIETVYVNAEPRSLTIEFETRVVYVQPRLRASA